jgi:YidC/Oxa1 family membrane protein insertase
MDKKSLLAFAVIFIIILVMPSYFKWINKTASDVPTPSETDRPLVETPSQNLDTLSEIPVKPVRQDEPTIPSREPSKEITIDTDLYTAVIASQGGGSFEKFELKKYDVFHQDDTTLVQLINQKTAPPLTIQYISIDGEPVELRQNFKLTKINGISSTQDIINISGDDSVRIDFILTDSGGETIVEKSLVFYGNRYLIDIQTDLRRLLPEMATKQYNISWSGGINYTEPSIADEVRYSKAYAYSGGETDALDVKSGKTEQSRFTGQTDWTAIRTKYFAVSLIARGQGVGYHLSAVGEPLSGKQYFKNYAMHLSLPAEKKNRTTLFIGPLEYSVIKKLGVDLENIMSLGKLLRPISKGILWIFIRLHGVLPNYGWVLIVFAFLVKIVLYPLTNKSMQSMKEIQKLQPKIEELKVKYKNDPQKMSAEQMKLYKEHHVNPMGGCLPLLLQMPILIALFTVFRTTIELRHAPFIWWITDLSAPDTIFTLPFTIPIYGKHVNVLPIIMALSTVLQQKLSSTASTNPQQKMMTYLMPIMFFFMFNQFPSGLNLYYTLFNILTVLQQKFIPAKAKPKKKKPSTLDTLRKLQSKTKYK